jgi:hypothetical protein
MTKVELGYTDWLRDTLADDFKSSGMKSTAYDFEKCAALIDGLVADRTELLSTINLLKLKLENKKP